MAEFPTLEEFAKQVAEKALDEIEYNGRTIREWADLIVCGDVAERKTCHDTGESRVFRCSECGYGVNDIFEDMNAPVHLFERFKYWRFCPCCGAQIKEVRDD